MSNQNVEIDIADEKAAHLEGRVEDAGYQGPLTAEQQKRIM